MPTYRELLQQTKSEIDEVDAGEAQELLSENSVAVVDVRERDEWDEGHLMIRLDPNWDYQSCTFIPNSETAKVEKNIEQQYQWGQRIFDLYLAQKPKFPLSWHLVGPRASDSMFYIHRHEPKE